VQQWVKLSESLQLSESCAKPTRQLKLGETTEGSLQVQQWVKLSESLQLSESCAKPTRQLKLRENTEGSFIKINLTYKIEIIY
jgi:hypothetical protein